MQARQQGLIPDGPPVDSPIASSSSQPGLKRTSDSFEQEDVKRFRSEYTNGFRAQDPVLSPPPAIPTTNFRTSLRKSNKNPVDPSSFDPATLENSRTLLKAVFSLENEVSNTTLPPPVPDLSQHLPPDLPADLPIDENYHTALHWAAALGRLSVVQAFLNYGADLHLGNNVGETPLIRAILVTNNSDQDTFGRLLEFLSPSLRTVDNSGRSVLHHCALVAGVKGRASSARYYLETILVHIAKNEKGQFGDLINAQDSHGDTALNIAARVGNRALVRMLLDVGADKFKPNKLGLRPTDFGVEEPVSQPLHKIDLSRRTIV
jgi:ankyrin repeat protein